MVTIRLRRTGKTKQPSYRVVVADSRSPRDGKFIEIIGHYNPVRQPKVLEIKGDRARYWLSVGAQPSDRVAYLLKKLNVLRVPPEVEIAGLDTIEYVPDIYFPEIPHRPEILVEPDGTHVEADELILVEARERVAEQARK